MNAKLWAQEQALSALLASQQEIDIGRARDCPLPLAQLIRLSDDHSAVQQTYAWGLGSEVFHLKVDGHHWCVKRRKGGAKRYQFAFLTELLRRREIELLRGTHPTALPDVVCTTYGSLQAGILVSPWLRGVPVHQLCERNVQQMLAVHTDLARWGWFNWDPCPSNLLDDGEQVRVFDFGATGRFTPAAEFHSHGLLESGVHLVERLESRCLSGLWLSDDIRQVPPLFAYWRELGVRWAQAEFTFYQAQPQASAHVLQRLSALAAHWQQALRSPAALAEHWWQSMYLCHRAALRRDTRSKAEEQLVNRRRVWLRHALSMHYPLLVKVLSPAERAVGQTGLLAQLEAQAIPTLLRASSVLLASALRA
ncbi:MAG: hypothetical protein ACRCYV_05310 [Aeromonas sp.]